MTSFKFRPSRAGYREVLKSEEAAQECLNYARRIRNNAVGMYEGPAEDFRVVRTRGSQRVNAWVGTDTDQAASAQARDHLIERGMGVGPL